MSDSQRKHAKSVYESAIKMRDGGDVEGCLAYVRTEVETMPASQDRKVLKYRARLRFVVGEIQEKRGDVAAATDSYERALANDPDFEAAALRLVEIRIDSPEAFSHDMAPHYIRYVKVGKSRKLRFGALRRLQHILRVRLTDRAPEIVWRLEMLRRLSKTAPEINFPKLYLGRAFYLRGDYELAIRHLESLSGATAETTSVLNVLGRCHEKVGDMSAARAAYEKSLRLTPDQAGAHFRLGRIELKLSESES